MPDIYNLSGIVSGPDIGALATGMNTILHGFYYGYFIMFSVALVVFFYLKSKGVYSNAHCLAAVFWLNWLLTLLLLGMGLIPNWVMWTSVIVLIAFVFILYLILD